MKKIITVYRKRDNTTVVKVHRAYTRIHTKDVVNVVKLRINAILELAGRISCNAKEHTRMGT